MEKSEFFVEDGRPQQSRRGFAVRISLFAVLAILLTRLYGAELLPLNTQPQEVHEWKDGDVSWSQIKPSKSIEWHPCFSGNYCARLQVSLDWKNTSNPRTAAIAILRIPAKVDVTDKRYGGPILINPGGPGGSGVRSALDRGPSLQDIVDASQKPSSFATKNGTDLYFDIIGFDPRGVNNTTPSAGCFPDVSTRQAFQIQKAALGIVTDGGLSFNSVFNQISAISGTCSRYASHQGDDANDIGRYMSTPQVVEDMVAITEALAEWREKEGEKAAQCPRYGLQDDDVVERTRWRKGKEMIQYIGFSYGTVLGATLATLHPDRVKRVVIDGVADSDDYYAGTWLSNLQDTDEIMDTFYTECHSAGPHRCPVYSATGPHGTQAIVEQVLGRLRYSPISVLGSSSVAPDIVTYTDLMALLRDALYKPHDLFPTLAQVIYEISLQAPNGTTLAKIKQEGHHPFCPTQQCDRDGPWSKACKSSAGTFGIEVDALIHCTDGPDWTGKSINFHREKWNKLKGQSTWLGDYWSEITMYCSDMFIRPTYPFLPRQVGANNTAHPMLLASNTRDPVTPLRNAHKISARFNNSVVLEQDDDGHCALTQASLCTAKVVREYFQTGRLPKGGAQCGRGKGFFNGDEENAVFVEGLGEEDRHLYETVRKMGKVPRSHSWLGI